MDDGLIVETDEGLTFFRTPAALETYAEAIDVENGEYGRCWDPAGNLYQIRLGGTSVGVLLRSVSDVTVQAVHPPTNGVGELRDALLAFLVRLGEASAPLPQLSTRELLTLALTRRGWTE